MNKSLYQIGYDDGITAAKKTCGDSFSKNRHRILGEMQYKRFSKAVDLYSKGFVDGYKTEMLRMAYE